MSICVWPPIWLKTKMRLRTSISRAYYSVFHAATIQAKQNGYSGGSHKEIWATYHKDSDRNCRRLSTIGNQMKDARKAADYDATVPDIPDVMAQQLKYANEFMAMLATLPSTSPQP